MVVTVEFDKRQFDRINRALSKKNLAFAVARSLTDVAKDAKEDLINQTNATMQIRKKWVFRGYRIKAAQKKQGISGMYSAVGHTDWYMEDQLDDRKNIRSPKKAKWLWIPRAAKRTKAWSVERVLKKKNVFMVKKGNRAAIYQRKSKKKTILLYTGTKQQTIDPRFSLRKETDRTYQKKFARHFKKRMAQAMRTSK